MTAERLTVRVFKRFLDQHPTASMEDAIRHLEQTTLPLDIYARSKHRTANGYRQSFAPFFIQAKAEISTGNLVGNEGGGPVTNERHQTCT
jgi:hypothetical protein